MDNQNKPEVTQQSGWEREVIEKLALAAVTEQTRARRWSVFFKGLMFAYLVVVLGLAMYPKLSQNIGADSKDHTAVIDVVGMIAEGKDANADSIIEFEKCSQRQAHQRYYPACQFAWRQSSAVVLCV